MKVAKLNGKLLTNIKSKTILGGNTQEKTVTPSTERQVITADSGYTCLDKVNVEAVTSAIDSNIKPENIKKDVEILGVTGTMESVSVPTKSWLYITEYDSDGYFKAKTIGCSGSMPKYYYGAYNNSYKTILSDYLQEFEINKGVTSIGESAFYECSSLTSITIPDSVTSIENSAFYKCSSLTSITIPDSVTSIGVSPFWYCEKLANIKIPEGITEIQQYTFSNCYNLTSIEIPDSVTRIGSKAFNSCSLLPSIVMPSALTIIESNAFNSCYKLLLYDFRKATQVPKLSNVNAINASAIKKIVVPDSLYDEWITATNWSSSTNNIVSSIIKASDYEASL